MYKCVDGWTDWSIDRLIDEWMDGLVDRWIVCMDGWMNEWMHE